MAIKERYIDPFTDFGFKRLFGSEPHKDLLIDFLNQLLKGEKHIQNLTYSKNEHLGRTDEYRKAVFDLYCENERGEKFIYLEMPKFNKNEDELVSHFDKWLYLLKNLHRFTEIPSVLQEHIFRKVFTIAEVSNLNEEEMVRRAMKTYEASLKDKRDWKNALDTALEEGMERGRKEGRKEGIEKGVEKERVEVVKRLKRMGVDEVIISQATQLSVEEIRKIVID